MNSSGPRQIGNANYNYMCKPNHTSIKLVPSSISTFFDPNHIQQMNEVNAAELANSIESYLYSVDRSY